MNDWPEAAERLLMRVAVAERFPAFLQLDKQARLVACGGDVRRYVDGPLTVGQAVEPQVPLLVGLVPLDDDAQLTLPWIDPGTGNVADLHLLSAGKFDWVLLLDAAATHTAVQAAQQTRYERLGPEARQRPSSQ